MERWRFDAGLMFGRKPPSQRLGPSAVLQWQDSFRCLSEAARKLRHADGRTAIVPVQRELTTRTFASLLRQAMGRS